MFGFIFKLVIFLVIVVGILFFVVPKLKGNSSVTMLSLPKLSDIGSIGSQLKNLDLVNMGKQLSQSLDSLVTHPGVTTPVVLGVQITDNSLDAIVKVLRNLPPDQYDQIKSYVCQPSSSSAAP